MARSWLFVPNIHSWKADVISSNMYRMAQAENSILYQFEAAQASVIASHPGADARRGWIGICL